MNKTIELPYQRCVNTPILFSPTFFSLHFIATSPRLYTHSNPYRYVLAWCWTESVQFSMRNNKVLWWNLGALYDSETKNFFLVLVLYDLKCVLFNIYDVWSAITKFLNVKFKKIKQSERKHIFLIDRFDD